MKSFIFIFVCFVGLKALNPYDSGMGPLYIGGSDSVAQANDYELVLEFYKNYINYKEMVGLTTEADRQYYRRWYQRNECIGSCPQHSQCSKGHCQCDGANGQVQVYGSCHHNTSASFAENSDDVKYRKPEVPPIPDSCYRSKKTGGREIVPSRRDDYLCKKIVFPNLFDYTSLFCTPGDHQFCLSKDINMFCGEELRWDPTPGMRGYRGLCQCRKDMKFDTGNMECRLYLDVDCTYVEISGYKEGDIVRMLRGEKPIVEQLKKDAAQQAFCYLRDRYLRESVEPLRGSEPKHGETDFRYLRESMEPLRESEPKHEETGTESFIQKFFYFLIGVLFS